MSSPARAMDFYSCEGKVVRRDQEVCFGWWLSELKPAAPLDVRVHPPTEEGTTSPSSSSSTSTSSASTSSTSTSPTSTSSSDPELGALLGDPSAAAAYQSMSLVQRLSPSAEQLARLVAPGSPTHRTLEAVLNVWRPQPGHEPEAAEPLRGRRSSRHRAASDWHTSPRRRELDRSTNELATAMRILQGKLRTMQANHRQMMTDIDCIHRELQTAIATTGRLTKAAQSLVEEMQDVRYLDELIFMMEGHLDRISQRVWPFTTAHVTLGPDTCEEYNLVV